MSSTRTSVATAQIGGTPTVRIDIPVCAVLLAIFVGLAASHMTILQINLRRQHKFLFSGALFGFCMSRILALTMRIVWATMPSNVNVALVASIFLNAGVLLAYIINNLLAWRLVRSASPRLGWNRFLVAGNKAMLWLVLGFIIPLIIMIVLRLKKPTLPHLAIAVKVVSRAAQTYFLIIAVTPIPLLAWAFIACPPPREPKDPFGRGRREAKFITLGLTTIFAIIEAGFRCGTTWSPTPLASAPAWWDSKAAFYCFNFMLDIFILATFLIGRIDRTMHVPNHSVGPMSFSRNRDAGSVVGNGSVHKVEA